MARPQKCNASYKIQILKELGVKLTKEDKDRIRACETQEDMDRIAHTLIMKVK